MANKPNNPALWSRAKSMAKQKFDVYPSAYANGWAAKWYKSKGGTWRKAEYGMEVMGNGGTPDNPGFNALPPAVQQKIMDNMAQGGEKMPPEIARARFAAAGNLDKMSDYGYAYGGYIPEMMFGGYDRMQQGGQQDQITMIVEQFAQMNQVDPKQIMQELQQLPVEQQQAAIQKMAEVVQQGGQQPDMMQAAMAYGGYTTGVFADGGEPNGGMALGQMSAVADKMSKLRQFVSPEQNLDPWIASKLAIMDDSANAISDYMMYNPEAQEDEVEDEYEQEDIEEMMANGGYVVTRSNDRKGKTHKVTGPDGTVKYFGDSKLGQHPKDPERKKAFYARHKKNLENNPFFRAFARKTWKEGGSTFSGNAWYQEGGTAFPTPYSNEYMDDMRKDYNEFYSDKAPNVPYARVPKNDDGFDSYYHSKRDGIPQNKIPFTGWTVKLKGAPDTDLDYIDDDGKTPAPIAKKNRIVTRVDNGTRPVDPDLQDIWRQVSYTQQSNAQDPYTKLASFMKLYQTGGEPQLEDYPDYGSWRADMYRYNAGQMGEQAQQAVMQEEPKMMWHREWEEQGIDPEAQNSARTITPASASTANIAPTAVAPKIDYSGVSIVDLLRSTGKASDYNSRKQLAEQLGIDGYYGSAKQNLDLIKKITSNPAVLNDYKPVASSSRSSSPRTSTRQSASTNTGTKADPIVENMRKLEESRASTPAGNINTLFAQAKNAYLAANPGMTSADYDAMMAANRPKQATIGPATRPLPAPSGSDPYDDSYMLNKIANDPETPGNVRKRKQKDFAINMGTALLAALIPNIGITRYYPLLRGLPQFANAASKGAKALPSGVRALPQAARALPKPGPTNWVTNSGMAFNMGGSFPMEEYKQGGINLDPAKKGTFKAQATRMGMGVQEAASAILNAPEGKYSPAMRKKANFAKNFAKQMGGPVAGEIMDVTPEQLEALRQQGYEFEIM